MTPPQEFTSYFNETEGQMVGAHRQGMDMIFESAIRAMDGVANIVEHVDVRAVRNFTSWLATPEAKSEIQNITARGVGAIERAEGYVDMLLRFTSRLRLTPDQLPGWTPPAIAT